MTHTITIKATANEDKLNFTLECFSNGEHYATYETNVMSEDEFNENEFNTQDDWKQFLKSEDYYRVQKMIKALKDLLFRHEVIIVEDYTIEKGNVMACITLYEDKISYIVADVFNDQDKQPSFNVKIDEVEFENYLHDNDLNLSIQDDFNSVDGHKQTTQVLEIKDCISEENILSYLRDKDDFEITPIE